MKFSINQRLKIALIVVLVFAIGGTSFLLYRAVKHPGFEEQNVPIYSYNNKATVDFMVYFKPNELYNTKSMNKDQIYITEFVDHIRADFNYQFSGDKANNLSGTYNIIAKVTGYTTDKDNNVINIWERDFTLVPSKNFTINGKTKSIRESVNIPLADYNAFVTKIIQTSMVNCQTSLNVIMNINLKGDTGVGKIDETLTPSLAIPLNTSTIEITGNRKIDQPGVIEETRQVQLPVNRKLVIIYGVIIGVLVIGAVFLIFFTKGTLNKDPHEKTLKKIFKKHGDRLVALNTELLASFDNINTVKSIDDLVRIADELGKPIMYKYSDDYRDITRFYVINEDQIYMFDLSHVLIKEKLV